MSVRAVTVFFPTKIPIIKPRQINSLLRENPAGTGKHRRSCRRLSARQKIRPLRGAIFIRPGVGGALIPLGIGARRKCESREALAKVDEVVEIKQNV